jgi:hypothetical protein
MPHLAMQYVAIILPDLPADRVALFGGRDCDAQAMTKGTKRRSRQKKEPVVITVSIVVLCLLAFASAGMLLPPLWTVVVNDWQFRSRAGECSMLENAAARQGCYADLGNGAASHPVKGANPSPQPHSGRRDE